MVVKVFVLFVGFLKRCKNSSFIISSKFMWIDHGRARWHDRLVLVFVFFILKDKQIGRNCAHGLVFEGDSSGAILIHHNTVIGNKILEVCGAFIRFFDSSFNGFLFRILQTARIFNRCKLRILQVDMVGDARRIVLLANGIMPVTSKTINTRSKTKRISVALFPCCVGHFTNIGHIVKALPCRLPVYKNALQTVGVCLITFPLTSRITCVVVSLVLFTVNSKQLLPAFAGQYLIVFKIEVRNAFPVFWSLVGFMRHNTITIAIREGKLRGTGRPKRLITALIGKLFNARIGNFLYIC